MNLLIYMKNYLEHLQNCLGRMLSQGITHDTLTYTTQELQHLMQIQEESVFRAISHFPAVSDALQDLMHDHRLMRTLLEQLSMDKPDETLHPLLVQLMDLYQPYVDETEMRLFPFLQKLPDDVVESLTGIFWQKEKALQEASRG